MTITKKQSRSSRKRNHPRVFGTAWGNDPTKETIFGMRLPKARHWKQEAKPVSAREAIEAKYTDLNDTFINKLERYAAETGFDLQNQDWEAVTNTTQRAKLTGVPVDTVKADARLTMDAIEAGEVKGFTFGRLGYFREGKSGS